MAKTAKDAQERANSIAGSSAVRRLRMTSLEQRLRRHLRRLVDAEDVENCRRDILESARPTQRALLRIDENERHRIRRVRGVRLIRLLVEHQLGVAVIGG